MIVQKFRAKNGRVTLRPEATNDLFGEWVREVSDASVPAQVHSEAPSRLFRGLAFATAVSVLLWTALIGAFLALS